jgi:hypothetical protein
VVLVQVFGSDELQDRITKVFEALVVARRQVRALIGERAVGDRLEQEARVAEMDSDLLLEQL